MKKKKLKEIFETAMQKDRENRRVEALMDDAKGRKKLLNELLENLPPKERIFTNETSAGTTVKWTIDPEALLLDFKYLANEYYTATFNGQGNALKLSFENGQDFLVTVTECKKEPVSEPETKTTEI